MKKKIFLLAFAVIASLGLASCDDETPTNNNNNDVVTRDRGTLDTSTSHIDLPDVLFDNDDSESSTVGDPEPGKPNYDEIPDVETTDDTISTDDTGLIEIPAGSATIEANSNGKFLQAKPNIGYNFLGWYLGDELLSTELLFKADSDAEKIAAKFEIKEEFKDLIFESNQTECNLIGVKDTAPKNLVLPEGITKIKKEAFKDSFIVILTLPESLNEIEEYAFDYSLISSIKFKKIPDIICDYFDSGSNLCEIYLPENKTIDDLPGCLYKSTDDYLIKYDEQSCYYIIDNFLFKVDDSGWYADLYLSDNPDVVFPDANFPEIDGIDNKSYDIKNRMFSSNNNIESVKFSDSVKCVGEEVFYQCYNLKTVDFGSGINHIKDYAFYECISLTDLTIPKNVFDIGYRAFSDCSSIAYVNIGTTGVYEDDIVIDSYAFYGCESLLTVILGDDVKTIEYNAFKYCDSMISITLGKNLNAINSEAFSGCEKLKTIYNYSNLAIEKGSTSNGYVGYYADNIITTEVNIDTIKEKDNFKYIEIDGVIYLIEYNGEDINVTVPSFDDKKIVLSKYLFYYSEIESIILNENVTRIEDYVFGYCENLRYVDLLNVEYIGYRAFYECDALNFVNMPKVIEIGNKAFEDCISLYQAILPQTLTNIGYDIFDYCIRLKELVNLSNGYVDNYYGDTIDNLNDSKIVKDEKFVYYVDDTSKTLISVIDFHSKIIEVPTDVTNIYEGAFYRLDDLEELDLHVLDNYFYKYFGADSSYNVSYYIPHTLKNVKLLDGITYVYSESFENCRNIESITLNKDITTICYDAFSSTNISKLYYDGTIADWMNISFENGDANPLLVSNCDIYFKVNDEYTILETINIPDTVTAIDDYRFAGFNMKEVVLPDSLTTEDVTIDGITKIGYYAFANCKNLSKINFPSSLTYIDGGAFIDTSLEDVTISPNLTYLGSGAFSGTRIKKIVIPSNITTISNNLFENCYNLQYVKIEAATSIGIGSFLNCRSLYTLILPDSLETIDVYAFSDCENLEDVNLKNTNVTELTNYSFKNCKSLVNFEFPQNLTTLSSTTFEGCDNFEAVTYNNGCYVGTEGNPYRWLIKARAKTIVNVTVHPDCEKVFESAFKECKNLKKIIIPSKCTDFAGILKGLTKVEYVELPYLSVSSKTFGNLLFGVDNGLMESNVKTIVVNGGQIANNAFVGLTSVETITVKDGVTIIGNSAFENLSDVDIVLESTTLTRIGQKAFKGTSLTSFEAPTSLTRIEEYAFQNCVNLTQATLYSVTTLRSYAFSGCTNLETVKLSSKLQEIQYNLFENCSSLTTINSNNTLGTGTKEVYDYAFKNCTSLKTLSLNNVTSINLEAFMGSGLESIYINTIVTNIGENAFKNCTSLQTVNYQSSFIGKSMFEGCTALTSFSLGYVTKIKEKAFKNCTNLTTLSNLTKLTDIEANAFEGTGITSFTSSRELFIGSSAFKNCTSLETVSLTNENTKFNNKAYYSGSYELRDASYIFQGCSSLTNITLPSGITVLPVGIFMDCTSLASFDFSNITTVSTYSFKNTGFTTLNVPDNVSYILEEAFAECVNLETAIINGTLNAISIFSGCTALTSVNIGGSNTIIPASAFKNCSSLNEVILGDSVIEIGQYAFDSCGLTEYTIPSTIKTIGQYAFKNCNIDEIIVPGTITTLANNAFSNSGFKKATLNIEFTTTYIFSSCSKLEEIIIAEGIENLPNYLCYNCPSLNSVKLPSSLLTIGDCAFDGCENLSSIIIPGNVNTIGSGAFRGCTNLKDIYNYSEIVLEKGSTDNGYLAYYAENIYGITTDYDPINVDGFIFTVIDNKGYLMGYEGTNKVLVLPDSFDYQGNTINEYEIYSNAFFNSSIVSLTIPSSVEKINDYAFGGCYQLVEIYNLSDLIIVKGNSDNGCVSLYALVVHDSLSDKSLVVVENDFVFMVDEENSTKYAIVIGYGGSDTEIIIPSTITYYGEVINVLKISDEAFAGLNITSAIISEGITTLGRDIFKNCASLTTITVATTVVDSGDNPFTSLNIVNATVPTSMLKYINNTQLETLVVNAGTIIENSSLRGCTGLVSVTLPNTLTEIDNNAFYECSSLINITIPDSVTRIGQYAFYYCTALPSVILPNSTLTLDNYAFNFCVKLDYVLIMNNNITFKTGVFSNTGYVIKLFCYGTEEEFANVSYGSIQKFYYDETNQTGSSNKWHYDDNGVPVEYNRELLYIKLMSVVTAMKEIIQKAVNDSNYEYIYDRTGTSISDSSKTNSNVVLKDGVYSINCSALKEILQKTGENNSVLTLLNTINTNHHLYLEIYYYTNNDKYNVDTTNSSMIYGYTISRSNDYSEYIISFKTYVSF